LDIQISEKISVKDNLFKIIQRIIIYDVIFLILLRLALIFIPHEPQEFIYYVNLNFHFVIACLAWMNYRHSRVNKPIILIFSIHYTPYVIIVLLFIFSGSFLSVYGSWIIYHIALIYISSFQLFITFYIFILSLKPYKTKIYYLYTSIVYTFIICLIMYLPIFFNPDFFKTLEPVLMRSYYLSIINLSLLVVFWHQYTQSKLIFSEYVSSIISIYTILIGMGILHAFSYENDLVFLYFSQYFDSILYLIISILWILRLNYLNKPESDENENYIENYYMLHGFIEKPRKGILVTFYTEINKTALILGSLVLIFLGTYLFFYDKFEIFIRLSILLLIISLVISTILAIATWHKRWYDAMGFLFKKQK